MRGAFIVLEGLDRSGKSTQVDRLLERLKKEGRQARVQKFPDRSTPIGKTINAYLQSGIEMDDHAIHLLFAANRWDAAIERDLEAGITIVADRYAFSGIAFSAAKGLPFAFCQSPDTGLPLPDIVLYLTLTPETAAQRGAYGQERYESLEMQSRVRSEFARVAALVQMRHPGRWVEVPADGTPDEVEARVWAAVQPGIERTSEAVGQLWTGGW